MVCHNNKISILLQSEYKYLNNLHNFKVATYTKRLLIVGTYL